MGNVAVAFGSTFLAMSVFALVLFSYKFPPKLVAGLIVFEWVVVITFAAIGPAYVARNGGPFCEYLSADHESAPSTNSEPIS